MRLAQITLSSCQARSVMTGWVILNVPLALHREEHSKNYIASFACARAASMVGMGAIRQRREAAAPKMFLAYGGFPPSPVLTADGWRIRLPTARGPTGGARRF